MTTSSHICPPDHRHAVSSSCYLHHRCRCAPCRTAHADTMRARRRELAYGTYSRGLVDAEPVRAHLDWLRSQSMGVKTIAAASGVPVTTISRIIWPVRSAGDEQPTLPAKVTPVTAAALLAVRPDLALLADHAVIDATGYRRRLQALIAHGWTLPQVETAMRGVVTADRMRPWLHATTITAAGARTIVTVYDRLWLTEPPQATPQQRAMAQRSRRLATRNRWAPALAWDDIDTDPVVPTVDAPSTDPLDEIAIELALAGRGVRLTPGERRACVRVLHAKRWSDDAIAGQLRCAARTVERIRDELHLPGWAYTELEVMGRAAA